MRRARPRRPAPSISAHGHHDPARSEEEGATYRHWLAALALTLGIVSPVAAAVEIGGAVYTFNLEGDGQYHLRGYACNRNGEAADQGHHPSIEVYLDGSVRYDAEGRVVPGGGTLIKAATADQPGSTQDEANACGYTRKDSPGPSFWQNMRFDVAFTLGELGPIVGRSLYVVGAYHASATAVAYADLGNNPVVVPALAMQPLQLACVAIPTTPSPGDAVTWTVAAKGGTGAYAFAWSDSDGHVATTGSNNQWTPVTYAKSGVKTVTVSAIDNYIVPNTVSTTCTVPVVLTVNTAVLPTARWVTVGATASAFLSAAVYSLSETATGCRIEPDTSISAGTFSYQETDAATNAPIGALNPVFSLSPSAFRSFVLALSMPDAFGPTEVAFTVVCDGGGQSVSKPALNTLLFGVSATATPDAVAVSATPTSDGVLRGAANVPSAFSVAVANNATVSAGLGVFVTDTSKLLSFDRLTICQTNPQTAQCLATPVPGGMLFTLGAAGTTGPPAASATFSVFLSSSVGIPFDPDDNRILVEFKDFFGVVRGRTSVAITVTPPPDSK